MHAELFTGIHGHFDQRIVHGFLLYVERDSKQEVAHSFEREKDHNLTFKWRARLFNLIFRLSLRDLSWVIINFLLNLFNKTVFSVFFYILKAVLGASDRFIQL